jgi:HemY protein
MIRVAVFLAVVGLIALGVAWFADRPGEVSVVWLGWRIETSLMVLATVILAVIAAGMLLWSILRGLWHSPQRAAAALRNRRDARGQRAIVRGLLAVGAGDSRAARRYAEDARKITPQEPLALLLAAQSAQLGGDRAGAERAFRQMAANDQTRLLGLRGLFIEAQRNNDLPKASLYAEEAAKIAPSLPWAGQAVLQLRCATGDWAGALDMLERNRAAGALERASYKRQRAVLLTARALSLEDKDRDTSKALVFEAVKLAPDLVPAVALSARYLAEDGEIRKASRMLERAWQAVPHPDLAETYAYLRFGDSARDRFTRVQKLAGLAPDNIESAIALARAAIDARDFAQARRAMSPFLSRPSQRVALLMSDLEQAESSDEGRAREWTARAVHAARDPAWTADGFVSERWLPISPVTGRIDAFEWKAPVAEIGDRPVETEVAETKPPSRPMIDVAPAAAAAEPVSPERKPESRPVVEARMPRPRPAPIAESVVPITHVPDDPGPDPFQEPEPVPEQTGGSGWKRLFQ